MKLSAAALSLAFFATLAAAKPEPVINEDFSYTYADRIEYETCTGYRFSNERCQGKRLGSRVTNWWDCQDMGGKCCGLKRNGVGGFLIDPEKQGGGSYRYGGCDYCFSGGCVAS
ncbi:predicted protein [Uncinocarpus reesii 1704]|uniref:Uncharacterized protein n=1 Tax=Uncinocarpus reesii (strain UAMH 1704) TaxID=336963 RepID=C4JQ40_UNCRE|nr:uncharacterized protein UREG_03273 [Uncinocarpus reesii 1704]EEP78427.1 predicted protein [Uncinocarpus reesii 1704]